MKKNKIIILPICITLIFSQGCSTIKYVKEHPYKALGKVAIVGLTAGAAAAKAYSQSYQSTSSSYQPVYPSSYNTQVKVVAPQSMSSIQSHYTANSVANFDYISGSNGYSGTGQQIGNFYYYHDNQGNSYTTQSIGQFDYTNGTNGYSGTGQNIGNFYYYNDNQGGRYNLQSIGNFDYISGTNGYHGSGQRIGNFYYYRDNE